MNLIELNEKIMSSSGKKEVIVPPITDDDVSTFVKILSISSTIKDAANAYDDANSFFKAYPHIRDVVGKGKCVEVFYGYKLGVAYCEIPNKLAYIIKMARNEENNEELPNVALARVVNLLKTYADSSYKTESGVLTVKSIIDNVYGRDVKLLTDGTRKVKNGSLWEIWVPDIERVAIVPEDIALMLSFDDLCSLHYDFKLGIALGDKPLRTFGDRIGITRNDFDLRECI